MACCDLDLSYECKQNFGLVSTGVVNSPVSIDDFGIE